MHFLLILQAYLSDSEFQTVFGMTKDAFYQQPNWKQELQKRKADLFWREQASYLVSAIKFDLVIVNGGPYHILSVISEDRLLVALLNWFFATNFIGQFFYLYMAWVVLLARSLYTVACFVTVHMCISFFLSLVCYVWAFPGRSSLYCHSDVLHTKYLCYLFAVDGLQLNAWLNLSARTNKWSSGPDLWRQYYSICTLLPPRKRRHAEA